MWKACHRLGQTTQRAWERSQNNIRKPQVRDRLFPNPGNVLRPGQYGRVRAVTRRQEGALLVPQRAVSELQGRYQIAVVDNENKINIRTVKVGERVGTMWIIDEGLHPGERVVVEGLQEVRPGMVVHPVESKYSNVPLHQK